MKFAMDAFCMFAALAATACANAKVKLPASDSTPPTLVWNVYNHSTGAQADHSGSPTLVVKRGEAHRIMLKANDPEGVKQIQLNPSVGGGGMAWQCVTPPSSGSLAQSKTSVIGPQTQDLSPDASGLVLTSIFLIQEMPFAMECQAGWLFNSGSAQLTGRASNYFGGTTTEVIHFNVVP